jgi:hypothetical protein
MTINRFGKAFLEGIQNYEKSLDTITTSKISTGAIVIGAAATPKVIFPKLQELKQEVETQKATIEKLRSDLDFLITINPNYRNHNDH